MKTFFKGFALLVGVTCVVWIAVLWYWQAHLHDMSSSDIVIYLIALPLSLFVLLLLGRWALRGALARQAQLSAAGGAATTSPAASGPQASPGPDAHPGWRLLGAWMALPGGTDAKALSEAAADGQPRPAPDTALRDDDGLPLLTARLTPLDLDGLADAMTPDEQSLRQRDEVARALAALHGLLPSLAQTLAHWTDAFQVADGAGRARPSSRVRVLANWPAAWTEPECAVASDWLARQLSAAGEGSLPANAWVIQSLQVSGAEHLTAADHLLSTLQQQQQDDVVVLLSAHSDLSDQAIARMERAARLFHANHRPRGAMPGEGAVAVLLGTPSWPESPEGKALRLHRPVALHRDTSADTPGRVEARSHQSVVTQALALAGVTATQIGQVITDADQHSSRSTELFSCTLELFPELDPSDDLRLLGIVTGHLGPCGPLAALAAATAPAPRPVLVTALADPHWRVALVVTPPDFSMAP